MKKKNSGFDPSPMIPPHMDLIDRARAPTPRFFRILRNIGITVAGVGGALLASPVLLPAILVQIAGYLTVAGTVITTVSQVSVVGDQ
ncbi:MAG: hypothetical protein K9I85_05110 [Saprospiraceae bacterium]|nr:hypothetical protein [Saprospiraceae bacterium]